MTHIVRRCAQSVKYIMWCLLFVSLTEWSRGVFSDYYMATASVSLSCPFELMLTGCVFCSWRHLSPSHRCICMHLSISSNRPTAVPTGYPSLRGGKPPAGRGSLVSPFNTTKSMDRCIVVVFRTTMGLQPPLPGLSRLRLGT